jgi:hypothetical protein
MAQRGHFIHSSRRLFCKSRPKTFVNLVSERIKFKRFQRLGSMAEWLRSGLQIRFAACFYSLFSVNLP